MNLECCSSREFAAKSEFITELQIEYIEWRIEYQIHHTSLIDSITIHSINFICHVDKQLQQQKTIQ